MTNYLVFRLYAPLASWGEAAVGESRPTATYPGRAAIVGLLAAALGIERNDNEAQEGLADSICVAVKQRSPGILMRDYHSTQVPSSQPKVSYRTRREELSVAPKVLNTILSSRDYRCDGLWSIAVWLKPSTELTLEALEAALLRPRFSLYLGRKACPIGAPLAPRVVQVEHLREALDTVFPELMAGEKRWLQLSNQSLYCWEGRADQLDGKSSGVESNSVWDVPLNRRRWQFGQRLEFRRWLPAQEAG